MKTTARKMISALFSAPQLCIIALMAFAVSPSARAADVDAFGQQLSIPKNTASGTILARHYITPSQICGQSKCTATRLASFPNGGASTSTSSVITTNVSGISTRLLINGTAYGTGDFSIEFSQPIEVQLLGDGRANLGGSLAGFNASPFYYSLVTQGQTTKLYIYLKGTITPIDGTCSVPNQTVKLPKTLLNRLDRIGSTAGTQSFQIQINNCPKGYNRIGYTLDPVGGVIANSPGVLPLTGGSSASGIKIRVENAQGAPATMGSSVTVDGYNKTAGGSFAIPMQASYIRTDVTATPGTVNGAMTVFLDYR
ncbi:type 1 fimbrial protein [Pseudomonas sp. GW456-L14]|uniref:fimbrial protein n=1 Tax=unclassified Pseudomonas TaxID=196821 RepID=UPI000C883582|nr:MULTISPECIES: fimbrial protein [unclassified Pseudomonas]PMY35837.1 type 1 fimbrial protein [Pseudomonas sp. GW456-L14]PMY51394.1 type 1 fimbrial protein [Pseudomonas sp. GW456-L12]